MRAIRRPSMRGGLGAHLDMPSLHLKNETVLPTRSTKDRMAAVSLGFLWERGVRAFCTSSTGNSSTSYAHAIRAFPGMTLYLFTAESFVSRVQHADHPQVVHFGMRDATFVEAFNYAAAYAAEHKLVSERRLLQPRTARGALDRVLQSSDQVPVPIDWYVQAVSSAMGVYGTYKGAKELHAIGHIDRLPKLLCAQQASCAPMVHAYEEGSDAILPKHVVARPEGIAEAILRGDPSRVYPYVKGIVVESGGDFLRGDRGRDPRSATDDRRARRDFSVLFGVGGRRGPHQESTERNLPAKRDGHGEFDRRRQAAHAARGERPVAASRRKPLGRGKLSRRSAECLVIGSTVARARLGGACGERGSGPHPHSRCGAPLCTTCGTAIPITDAACEHSLTLAAPCRRASKSVVGRTVARARDRQSEFAVFQ